MVKVLSANASKMYRNSEQYNDCSSLLKADGPPLEELDPAILSCGLPAIILSDIQPVYAAPIRYTAGQLLAIRKAKSCYRRPSAADDPRTSGFAFWRTHNNYQSNRRVNKAPTGNYSHQHKDNNNAIDNSTQKEKQQELVGKFRYQHNTGRENGFVGTRFRRNNEFSNNYHHVIVKSYNSDGEQHHHLHNHNTIIEEEPEWVTAGPTSRLDTIELRGFDDDLSVSQSSAEKTNTDDGKNSSKSSGKHISFYDELHHYEHVHAKKNSSDHLLKPHDSSSGRDNDIESVTTSNTGSPPPARSTPTKHLNEYNNMIEEAQKHNSGVNVNNFEELLKFDSLLGSDSVAGNNTQSGSRFSKWFRRNGNSFNAPPAGQSYDGRRNGSYSPSDNYAYGNNNRYPLDRNYQQQYQPSRFSSQANQGQGDIQAESNSAFKRLVDMMAQNRANNLVAQQQNLLQMLNKNQQSESLRRMLIKNTVDNASDANRQQPSQNPRVPTQFELQLHTQSIMQNALLRKKLQDQRKTLLEQNRQIAEMAVVAGKAEPNADVQQFVKSVSPNLQRSLSILNQTAINGGEGNYRSFCQSIPSGNTRMVNPPFVKGSYHPDLTNSLRQMLLPQNQQQQGSRPFGNRRRFEKRSVSWKTQN